MAVQYDTMSDAENGVMQSSTALLCMSEEPDIKDVYIRSWTWYK